MEGWGGGGGCGYTNEMRPIYRVTTIFVQKYATGAIHFESEWAVLFICRQSSVISALSDVTVGDTVRFTP